MCLWSVGDHGVPFEPCVTRKLPRPRPQAGIMECGGQVCKQGSQNRGVGGPLCFLPHTGEKCWLSSVSTANVRKDT